MSEQNFTIEISDAFLQRFPEEQRAVARTRAQYLIYNMMSDNSPAEINRSMFIDLTEFTLDSDHFTNRPFNEADKRREPSIAEYFDADAVIHISYQGKEYKLPAITMLCTVENFEQRRLLEAKDIIANHPFMNDEAGNGLYASPLISALSRGNWPMVSLLSFNEHLNPNEPYRNHFKCKLQTVGASSFKPVTNFLSDWEGRSLMNILCMRLASLRDGELSTFFKTMPFDQMLIRYIDHGAVVTEREEMFLACDAAVDVQEHIASIREHLASLDVAQCSVQDIKHAYAMQSLTPWFVGAQNDPVIRTHLQELREQLPAWLSDALSPAYELLDQQRWEIKVTDQENSGPSGGRFA